MSVTSPASAAYDTWRALVEKELAGKPFDKALVSEAVEGVPVAPLYVTAPPLDDAARAVRTAPLRLCTKHDASAQTSALLADVAAGADAVWIPFASPAREDLARAELAGKLLVLEAEAVPTVEGEGGALAAVRALAGHAEVALAVDPLAWRATGRASHATLGADLAALGALAKRLVTGGAAVPSVVVSTEAYHDAGADAADEIAYALATGVAYLEALLGAGLAPAEAAAAFVLRAVVGRDTFVELAKLRALRVTWAKVLVAAGVAAPAPALLHAVCSRRSVSVRDPWVNMLRGTTQVFAAITGGADWVTPVAFDAALETASPLGQRLARNTGLVLRDESGLARVDDPAGGSYYFDALTDALAREGWKRFQEVCAAGGLPGSLARGEVAARLEARWQRRLARIARRAVPVLGTSEFANLGETLPSAPRAAAAADGAEGGLPRHRDAEVFETLRARAEALEPAPEVVLSTLGPFAESRARAGFAVSFFSAGGLRTREEAGPGPAVVACLCGTDERYAEEGVARVAALKAAGVRRVLVAGRPGPNEAALRAAGVDDFVFVGCDVVASLTDVLSAVDGHEVTA